MLMIKSSYFAQKEDAHGPYKNNDLWNNRNRSGRCGHGFAHPLTRHRETVTPFIKPA